MSTLSSILFPSINSKKIPTVSKAMALARVDSNASLGDLIIFEGSSTAVAGSSAPQLAPGSPTIDQVIFHFPDPEIHFLIRDTEHDNKFMAHVKLDSTDRVTSLTDTVIDGATRAFTAYFPLSNNNIQKARFMGTSDDASKATIRWTLEGENPSFTLEGSWKWVSGRPIMDEAFSIFNPILPRPHEKKEYDKKEACSTGEVSGTCGWDNFMWWHPFLTKEGGEGVLRIEEGKGQRV